MEQEGTEVAMALAKSLGKEALKDAVKEGTRYVLFNKENKDTSNVTFDSLESANAVLKKILENNPNETSIKVIELPSDSSPAIPPSAAEPVPQASPSLGASIYPATAKRMANAIGSFDKDGNFIPAPGEGILGALKDMGAMAGDIFSFPLRAGAAGIDMALENTPRTADGFLRSLGQRFSESGKTPAGEERSMGGQIAQGILRDPTLLPLAVTGLPLVNAAGRAIAPAAAAARLSPTAQKIAGGAIAGGGMGAAAGTARPVLEDEELKGGDVAFEAGLGGVLGGLGGGLARALERTGRKKMSPEHFEVLLEELADNTKIPKESLRIAAENGTMDQILAQRGMRPEIADELLARRYLTDADLPESAIADGFREQAKDAVIPAGEIEAAASPLENWGANRLRDRGNIGSLMKAEEAVNANLRRQAGVVRNPNAGTRTETSALIDPATGRPFEKVTVTEPYADAGLKDFTNLRRNVGEEIANNKGWARNAEGLNKDYMDEMKNFYHNLRDSEHRAVESKLSPAAAAEYREAYGEVARKLKENDRFWNAMGLGKMTDKFADAMERNLKAAGSGTGRGRMLNNSLARYDEVFGGNFPLRVRNANLADVFYNADGSMRNNTRVPTGFSNRNLPSSVTGVKTGDAVRILEGANPANPSAIPAAPVNPAMPLRVGGVATQNNERMAEARRRALEFGLVPGTKDYENFVSSSLGSSYVPVLIGGQSAQRSGER